MRVSFELSIFMTFSIIGCTLVQSSPVPSQGKVISRIVKDETGTKRISHVLVDSTQEATNSNGKVAFVKPDHEPQHSSIIPDGPATSNEANNDHSIELQEGGQTFFPSFANLFQPRHQPHGHSRPVFTQEGAYSQRPSPLRQLLNNFEVPSFGGFKSNDYVKAASSQPSDSSGILGSGNFGVIPGGTFFSESSDVETQYSDSFDSPYNNGHGRPAFLYNPRPSFNEEQFANFRDFADINAPSSSAFSHYVVVYANKNATVGEIQDNNSKISQHHRIEDEPKNIIERLEQIDKEKLETTTISDEEIVTKKSKISKSKLKLSLIKDKKYGKKSNKKTVESETKDLSDPLIALS